LSSGYTRHDKHQLQQEERVVFLVSCDLPFSSDAALFLFAGTNKRSMEHPQHAKEEQAKPEASLKFGEPRKQDFVTYIQLHRFTYVWQPIFSRSRNFSKFLMWLASCWSEIRLPGAIFLA
jgi:hypothetical protein